MSYDQPRRVTKLLVVANDRSLPHCEGRVQHIKIGSPRPSRGHGQWSGISVVNIFLDDDVTSSGNLPLELNDLALNCSFFLLRVRAHTRV